jgi:hypothetical protein
MLAIKVSMETVTASSVEVSTIVAPARPALAPGPGGQRLEHVWHFYVLLDVAFTDVNEEAG